MLASILHDYFLFARCSTPYTDREETSTAKGMLFFNHLRACARVPVTRFLFGLFYEAESLPLHVLVSS